MLQAIQSSKTTCVPKKRVIECRDSDVFAANDILYPRESAFDMACDLPIAIGFIGLGLMGLPMARNLASKLSDGSEIYIYDISDKAMDSLTKDLNAPARIINCASPAEVASKAVGV